MIIQKFLAEGSVHGGDNSKGTAVLEYRKLSLRCEL